ncbi:hypothetical protein [Gymnodinialimonas sp.]
MSTGIGSLVKHQWQLPYANRDLDHITRVFEPVALPGNWQWRAVLKGQFGHA